MLSNKKKYCGIKAIPSGAKLGSENECFVLNQVRLWGKRAVSKKLREKIEADPSSGDNKEVKKDSGKEVTEKQIKDLKLKIDRIKMKRLELKFQIRGLERSKKANPGKTDKFDEAIYKKEKRSEQLKTYKIGLEERLAKYETKLLKEKSKKGVAKKSKSSKSNEVAEKKLVKKEVIIEKVVEKKQVPEKKPIVNKVIEKKIQDMKKAIADDDEDSSEEEEEEDDEADESSLTEEQKFNVKINSFRAKIMNEKFKIAGINKKLGSAETPEEKELYKKKIEKHQKIMEELKKLKEEAENERK